VVLAAVAKKGDCSGSRVRRLRKWAVVLAASSRRRKEVGDSKKGILMVVDYKSSAGVFIGCAPVPWVFDAFIQSRLLLAVQLLGALRAEMLGRVGVMSMVVPNQLTAPWTTVHKQHIFSLPSLNGMMERSRLYARVGSQCRVERKFP